MNDSGTEFMSRKIRIRQLALSLAVVLLIVGLAKTVSAASFVIKEPATPCTVVPCPGTITPLGTPVSLGDVVLLQGSTCLKSDPSCWSDIVRFTNDTAGNGVATILSDCDKLDCPLPPAPAGVFQDEFTGLIIQSITQLSPNVVFLPEDCSATANGNTVYNPVAPQPGAALPSGTSNAYVIVSDCEPLPPPGVPEPSSVALIALSLASFVPFALLRRKRLQATAN